MNAPGQNPAAAPLLDVRGLSVAFGGKSVVHGVDFSIAPGEKLALVGESGSGKTVTALALMQLAQNAHTTGSATLAGGSNGEGARELLSLPEREMLAVRGSDMAMIFQEPMTALNPLYTVASRWPRCCSSNGAWAGARPGRQRCRPWPPPASPTLRAARRPTRTSFPVVSASAP